MLNPISAGLLVIASLGGLIAAAQYARRRWGLPAEWSRKCVHVGMGLVCATLPWLFSTVAPVIVLAVIAVAMMLAIRAIPRLRATFGCALSDVKRNSYGEFAFIVGVASTFVLAHGNLLEYLAPLSVLTFADSLAAIVGQHFGTFTFPTPSGAKTVEGSAAFFAVSFATSAAALLMVHAPYALVAAIAAAVVLTLVEALSWNGFDNCAIPIIGMLLLRLLAGAAGPVVAS